MNSLALKDLESRNIVTFFFGKDVISINFKRSWTLDKEAHSATVGEVDIPLQLKKHQDNSLKDLSATWCLIKIKHLYKRSNFKI